ncbi:MAG: hypothetical protein FWD09_09015 [Lentimicrobiaceae bacterium]|nr:hypothetical protein [Lentimicrobiaceae bacterium]
MAKKSYKSGIDRVFSSTVEEEENKEFKESKEFEETGDVVMGGTTGTIEPKKIRGEKEPAENSDGFAFYNLKYPKGLKRRIKQFLVNHEGVDMKDIFTRGAEMYMDGVEG